MGFAAKPIDYTYYFASSPTVPLPTDPVFQHAIYTASYEPRTLNPAYRSTYGPEIGKDSGLFSIDIGDDIIEFRFKSAAVWQRAPFNGVVISDFNNEIPPIAHVELKTNIRGLTARDITYTTDEIRVNLESISTDKSSYIRLIVTFNEQIRQAGTNGKDNLIGGQYDDILYGRAGNDRLDGRAGNDILDGGPGNDILKGGAGYDIFVFGKMSGKDKIKDFDVGSKDANESEATFHDYIDLQDLDIMKPQEFLKKNVISVQNGTKILLGDGNEITLEGVSAKDLTEDHFIF